MPINVDGFMVKSDKERQEALQKKNAASGEIWDLFGLPGKKIVEEAERARFCELRELHCKPRNSLIGRLLGRPPRNPGGPVLCSDCGTGKVLVLTWKCGKRVSFTQSPPYKDETSSYLFVCENCGSKYIHVHSWRETYSYWP